jgi:hypothetical protein
MIQFQIEPREQGVTECEIRRGSKEGLDLFLLFTV